MLLAKNPLLARVLAIPNSIGGFRIFSGFRKPILTSIKPFLSKNKNHPEVAPSVVAGGLKPPGIMLNPSGFAIALILKFRVCQQFDELIPIARGFGKSEANNPWG